VLDECRVHAPASRLFVADLSDLEGAAAVAREAWDAFGALDAVVHNAGVAKRRPVADLTFDEVRATVDLDFHSPVRMTLELLPAMIERRRGQFVFVSSFGGRTAIAHEAAYNAAKFALCGWAEAMFLDLHGTGVEVKLVLPGPVDTEIWDQPGSEPPMFDVEKVAARDCAIDIAAAMEGDGFEYYAPAVFPGGIDAKELVVGKTQDCDGYLRGMAEFAAAMRSERSGR
jgi:short-subunit dehydrogenase